MKNLKLLLILGVVLLAGCQAAEPPKQENNDNKAGVPVDTKLEGSYGKPYSNGPTTSPEEMTGPTTPPPETPAQAITTNENIRLTLPRKVE
jgi:hypothetical protein